MAVVKKPKKAIPLPEKETVETVPLHKTSPKTTLKLGNKVCYLTGRNIKKNGKSIPVDIVPFVRSISKSERRQLRKQLVEIGKRDLVLDTLNTGDVPRPRGWDKVET